MEEMFVFIALVVGALTVVLPVVVVVMVATMKGTLGTLVSKVDELRLEVARLKRRGGEAPAAKEAPVSSPAPATSYAGIPTPDVGDPVAPPPPPRAPPHPHHQT